MAVFDCRLPSGRTVADAVFATFTQANPPAFPRIVDVGARNGMHILPAAYCAMAELVGFEPNPEEFEKLEHGTTDAEKYGMVQPRFRATRYFPYAVWKEDGDAPFYVTVGAGASTMMGHTVPEIGNRIYKRLPASDPRANKSFLESISSVIKEINVPTRCLDTLLSDGQTIDFLKMDVEGAELGVMQGAQSLLSQKRILFILSEFHALPWFKNHSLLDEQWTFLREKGYRILSLDLNHPQYLRDPPIPGLIEDRGLLQAGDAYFMLDPDLNDLTAMERQRMAAICFCFGFNSLAIGLLREAGLTPEAEINAIAQVVGRPTLRRRVRRAWERFPETFAKWLYSFKG